MVVVAVSGAAFVATLGGFDTHASEYDTVAQKMEVIDETLKDFRDEMKLQGMWNNVTVVVVSEFGRTLTSNGQGTDHSWGGNAMVLGGDVRGGQVRSWSRCNLVEVCVVLRKENRLRSHHRAFSSNRLTVFPQHTHARTRTPAQTNLRPTTGKSGRSSENSQIVSRRRTATLSFHAGG